MARMELPSNMAAPRIELGSRGWVLRMLTAPGLADLCTLVNKQGTWDTTKLK